ncbi:MAG: intradiol ring-cleavage dioxygenase [Rhodobacteraceae bacterium]|nr:MAG: intradiol ring-cleavage dioxygenase [Paracoccaceae bacterium]
MTDHKDRHDHNEPEGLSADLPHLTRRRLVLTGLAMGGAALSLWGVRSGAQTVSGTGADGSVCVALPAETAGPFPADGTNVRAGQTVNILTEAGVIREDLRSSIGGLAPVAEGVPVTLEITLVDVRNACVPLGGMAVYVWQCGAEGVYSIYGAADRNYLRGIGISDVNGVVRFITIFPACYPGRWPHIHFEVFSGAEMAVSGKAALLTSQFALPEAECRAVYAAHPLYSASQETIRGVSLTRDGIFRDSSDTELAAQTLALEGDPAGGYRATGRVGLVL